MDMSNKPGFPYTRANTRENMSIKSFLPEYVYIGININGDVGIIQHKGDVGVLCYFEPGDIETWCDVESGLPHTPKKMTLAEAKQLTQEESLRFIHFTDKENVFYTMNVNEQ